MVIKSVDETLYGVRADRVSKKAIEKKTDSKGKKKTNETKNQEEMIKNY